MADTTFTDQSTVVTAEWLNDINDAYYDYNVLKYIPRTEWAAIKAGTSTYDCTTAIQAAIDAVHALYVGGTYGGGAGDVYFPPGVYRYTGITVKRGVNLLGDGPLSTILKLVGTTSTGIKCLAATTQLAADVVSGCYIKGIQFSSAESAPTTQVQWNLVGFTNYRFIDCSVEWFGGCSGITVLGATLAGSGGPAIWYNSFYDLDLYRLASRPSGGIGAQLGDTDINKEQITTWKFFGGRVQAAGSGTGMQVRGTGNQWYGMVFESAATAIDFGSNSTRGATGNYMSGCYFEGNTINRRFRANAVNTVVSGSFITGGTDDDLSTSTTYLEPSYYKANIPNAAGNRWEVTMDNGVNYRPVFSGSTTPGFDVKNSSGNYTTYMNLASSSTTWSWHQVYAVNRTVLLYEAGQGGMRPGADNTMSNGSASFRWSVIYAGTGTINTSDETTKTEFRSLTDKEKAVAKKLESARKVFKFKDAVKSKGKQARWHAGWVAQDVKQICIDGGIDPNEWGFFCEDILEDGTTRLGLRYDELNAFIGMSK